MAWLRFTTTSASSLPGKHTMTICAGTACYIKGADKLIAAAEKHLGIPQGQTTRDGDGQPYDRPLRRRLQPRAGGAFPMAK